MRTIVGLYDRFEDAQKVVRALKDAGFRGDDISLVSRDEGGEFSRQLQGGQGEEDIADGAVTGAGIGAVLGGLGGILVGLGALAIPGIGPVLAAGPIAAGLAGAGLGAVAGGVVGALVDLGIPEDQAHRYAEGLRRGGTLVVLRSEDNLANQAVQVMNRFNPIDVNRRSADWQQKDNWTRFDDTLEPMPMTQTQTRSEYMDRNTTTDQPRRLDVTNQDETTIPIIEEEIEIGKREVETGGVHVSAHVEETPVEKNIDLRHERVEVERRPVDREVRPGDQHFVEGELHMTEHSEQPMVQKTARVTEEINIHKDVEQRQETVRDTVRKQVVDIQNMTDTDWRTYDQGFQSHYRNQYGTSGRDYGYYQNAYRYGYTMANDDRYRSKDWSTIEPQFRSQWEREHPDSAWEDFKDAVRHGWESLTR